MPRHGAGALLRMSGVILKGISEDGRSARCAAILKVDDDRYRCHCERCGDDGAYSKNNHCSRPVAHRHDAAHCLKMLLNA
jgi:hypothetical protein